MLTTQLATTRLEDEVRRAHHDLESVLRLLKAAVRRMDDAEPGYPGGSHGAGTGDDSGPLRSAVVVRDDAIRDRQAIAQLTHRAADDARALLAICHRWGIARHGSTEGVDERSTVCDSCGHNDRLPDRRVCSWCQRTLKALNDIRAGVGAPPYQRLPKPALDHVRNGRMRRVTPGDLERWARNEGRGR